MIQETVRVLGWCPREKYAVYDSLPVLLTSLQAMWLIDLRECPDGTRNRRKRDDRVRNPPLNCAVTERGRVQANPDRTFGRALS